MYVIFPADDVVFLTYGRVIVPRHSNSQLTPVLNQLRASAVDVTSIESLSRSLEPNKRNNSHSTSDRSDRGSDSRGDGISGVNCVSGGNCGTGVSGRNSVDGFETTSFNGISNRNSPLLHNCNGEHTSRESLHFKKSTSRESPNNKKSKHLIQVPDNRPYRDKSPNKSIGSDRSPQSQHKVPSIVLPELAPDPRLQLTGLQQTTPEKSPTKKKSFFGTKTKRQVEVKMAASNESTLRDLSHPNFNEALKSHNAVTFKLVRTVSDFTQQLSQIYEQHAEELQLLVSNFRKRNGELRKERPACPSSLFHTWETLLQEVEIDSQAHSDIASILGRQVSRPLLEKSFHRKIQSRKVFTHRESYETIISKTEEKLAKCRQDYKNAYLSYLSVPTTQSLSAYFDSHNAYVQQLHATNGMLDEYSKETLPQLLQELEEIYTDLCSTLSEAVLQGAEVVSTRAMEQYKRYEGLSTQCRTVSGPNDLAHFVRSLPNPPPNRTVMKRLFAPPQPPVSDTGEHSADIDKNSELQNENIPPPLKNELVVDRLAAIQVKPSYDALRKEAVDLEVQIKQIQDALDTLVRIQQRSLESNLFNKVNEVQEDISMKRFDLRVAQIHLRAINAQKELFSNKLDSNDSGRERKMSSASTGSMKSKWLKAFKSLKTPPTSGGSSPKEAEKKNGAAGGRDVIRGESDAHNFQEYTYKKITPCDVCSQVLRGHTRQGLKCRICKMNVHVDCQEKVGKCQSKSRLLRRQKSTSEIETKIVEPTVEEENPEDIYFGMPTMNRQLSFKGSSRLLSPDLERRAMSGTTAPDGSMRRRLFAGMKSLTGFGSRSRQSSPHNRSISLPEKRGSTSGQGNRPFGQPLCLSVSQENGNGHDLPPTPPSPAPSNHKSKQLANNKKLVKNKK